MHDLELKPTEVRKSERLPLIVAVWGLICCAVLAYAGLAVSDFNWKAFALVAFACTFVGYLLGTRFRITLK